MSDQQHHGGIAVARRGFHNAAASVDVTAADMSDDLYSEINSHDTQQLLKSRVGSRARRPPAAPASTSTSELLSVSRIVSNEELYHSHTSSVPPTLNSSVTLHVPMNHS